MTGHWQPHVIIPYQPQTNCLLRISPTFILYSYSLALNAHRDRYLRNSSQLLPSGIKRTRSTVAVKGEHPDNGNAKMTFDSYISER